MQPEADDLSVAPWPASVHVVVVTYGDRLHLVQQVVRALVDQAEVCAVTVVDNGAVGNLEAALDACRGRLHVSIVRLPGNQGSAIGFARGLQSAAESGRGHYLLMLDDDNQLRAGGVRKLLSLYDALAEGRSLALCCLRAGRAEYEALLKGRVREQLRPNSCLGFHVDELPSRLWRRLRRRAIPVVAGGESRRVARLQYAPYGGLLLPSALVRATPGPDESYILYSDDNEYTARLARAGVPIYLTDVTLVDDLDHSWSESTGRESVWVGKRSPRWRVYYSARNRMRFEQMFVDSPWVYELNRRIVFLILRIQALLAHRSLAAARKAFTPLTDAWSDFTARRFGRSEHYPLPTSRPAVATNQEPA